MIREKSEIKRSVDEVYELTIPLKRGDVLTHEAIRDVLGLAPHEGSWDHILKRVRRRLEKERGIATWSEHGVGYKLLTIQEHLELPFRRTQRGLREIHRGRTSLNVLPDQGLTLHQKQMRFFQSEWIRDTEHTLRRGLLEQMTHYQPVPTLPRRPLVQTP